MLSKYRVQSLQDLALEQLPSTKALSKKLYIEHGNRRAALQAVAWAPTLLINSPLSTSLEVLAGRLLALVGQHPCTHTEYLIEKMDGDDGLCISVEDAVLWAEQDRPYIEEALLETARQLCDISGANLPPWMNVLDGQFAPEQNTATPAPVAADDAPEKQFDAMKKAALIAALEYEWPSIEADISDATRNGLKAAAHTGKHGEWDKDKARAWAVSKGKIKQTAPVHSLAGAWPGTTTRHTISH